MKSFSCGDVVPGCTTRFTAATDQDILRQVGTHAATSHGMTTVPDDVAALVRRHIVDVGATGR